MADSDSDGAEISSQSPKKIKMELTVKEKEERFLAAAKISPQYDTMVRNVKVFLLDGNEVDYKQTVSAEGSESVAVVFQRQLMTRVYRKN